MDSETIEHIQTRIAFLERANSDLSDVLVRQQREIQLLTAMIKELSQRLGAIQSAHDGRSPEDERPPHY
jgi:SlyX protein